MEEAPLQISARMASRLLSVAQRLEIDGHELCRRHGLDRAAFKDKSARVSLNTILAALEELRERSASNRFSLDMALCAEREVYHTPGLVLMASNTLREGLARAFELQRLWGDGDRFSLCDPRELGVSAPGLGVVFRIEATRRPGHEILEVCALVETMAAVRALTGRSEETPVCVLLPSTSESTQALDAYFGVQVRVGQPRAAIVLADESVDCPLTHANEMFRTIFEQQAQEELGALPPERDFFAVLKADILRGLAAGRANVQDCARLLGVSSRTLERQLARRGTSFQRLLDESRMQRALSLLATDLPIAEVAALLGYSERSAFHRACLRWFGETPAQLRRGKTEPKHPR